MNREGIERLVLEIYCYLEFYRIPVIVPDATSITATDQDTRILMAVIRNSKLMTILALLMKNICGPFISSFGSGRNRIEFLSAKHRRFLRASLFPFKGGVREKKSSGKINRIH